MKSYLSIPFAPPNEHVCSVLLCFEPRREGPRWLRMSGLMARDLPCLLSHLIGASHRARSPAYQPSLFERTRQENARAGLRPRANEISSFDRLFHFNLRSYESAV